MLNGSPAELARVLFPRLVASIRSQTGFLKYCCILKKLCDLTKNFGADIDTIKFGYSEKATKFEKIFHLKFDLTEKRQILSGRFFQILWPSQNIRTLTQY